MPSRAALAAELVTQVSSDAGSRAWLLTGPPRSGRTSVLEAAATSLRRNTKVLRLSMGEGLVRLHAETIMDRGLPLISKTGQGVTWFAKVARLLGEPLISTAASTAGSALKVGSGVGVRLQARRDERVWHPDRLLDAVRGFEGQLLVLADDIDQVDLPAWWWSRFFAPLCEDASARTEVAVIMTAKRDLVNRPLLGEPLSTVRVAQLSALTVDDMRNRYGDMSPRVTHLLTQLAGSQPGLLEQAWGVLTDQRMLLETEEGWDVCETTTQAQEIVVFAISRQLASIGFQGERADDLLRVLELASLQPRYFTAEVTADLLGLDRDEVIDLLDELQDQTLPRPWVKELDNISTSAGPLWRYSMSEDLRDQLMLLMREEQAIELAGPLARGLLQAYQPLSWLIGAQAVYLFDRAGLQGEARDAYLLCNDVEPQVARVQLEALLRPGARRLATEEAFYLALRLLTSLYGNLNIDELIAFHRQLVGLASDGSRALQHEAAARLAQALTAPDDRPEYWAEALPLVTWVLQDEELSTARLSALWAKQLLSQRMGDWQKAAELCEKVAEEALRLGNEEATRAQALGMRATLLFDHGASLSELSRLLDDFRRIAHPENPFWPTFHRIHMQDAYARHDWATMRSHASQAERSELAAWDYFGAAGLVMFVLQMELSGRGNGLEVSQERLLELLSKAQAHALRSGDGQLLKQVTELYKRITGQAPPTYDQ